MVGLTGYKFYAIRVNIMIRIKPTILIAVIASVVSFVLIFSFGGNISEGIRTGLSLCGEIVIPSLFPFMVLSGFMMKSGAADAIGRILSKPSQILFKLPGCAGTAVLLSFISGYPVGAKCASDLYKSGKITQSQARRMLCFTVNAGPAMIVLAVGSGMLGSQKLGWVLLSVHIISALLIGIISARFSKDKIDESTFTVTKHGQNLADSFVESTSDAAISMLGICAFVVLFSAVINVFSQFGSFFPPLLEVTVGCESVISARSGLPVVSAVLGWSGISVHCQVMSSARAIKPRPLTFILSRACHAAVSYIVCTFAIKLMPETVEVISNNVTARSAPLSFSVPLSCIMLAMSAMLLWYSSLTFKNKK